MERAPLARAVVGDVGADAEGERLPGAGERV